MAMRCANHYCGALRSSSEEGKLFRLDLELGSTRGGSELHTEYLWLCSDCAAYLRPRVQVLGSSVQVRLTSHCPAPDRIPPQFERAATRHLSVH